MDTQRINLKYCNQSNKEMLYHVPSLYLPLNRYLRKLTENNLIAPVEIITNGEITQISTIAYADDITCITSDKESIQVIINEYEKFSLFSGIKLNVKKTEILIAGKKTKGKIAFELSYMNESHYYL
jgi:hypothetical protein